MLKTHGLPKSDCVGDAAAGHRLAVRRGSVSRSLVILKDHVELVRKLKFPAAFLRVTDPALLLGTDFVHSRVVDATGKGIFLDRRASTGITEHLCKPVKGFSLRSL